MMRVFAFCDDLMWTLTKCGWSEWNRYYSMYGHVEKLAQEIRKGAAFVDGVDAKLWQVLYSLFSQRKKKTFILKRRAKSVCFLTGTRDAPRRCAL